MDKTKQSTEEKVKVVKESKTAEGRRLVTLQKGVSKTTRLEHNVPSYMQSEEWKVSSQLVLTAFLIVRKYYQTLVLKFEI